MMIRVRSFGGYSFEGVSGLFSLWKGAVTGWNLVPVHEFLKKNYHETSEKETVKLTIQAFGWMAMNVLSSLDWNIWSCQTSCRSRSHTGGSYGVFYSCEHQYMGRSSGMQINLLLTAFACMVNNCGKGTCNASADDKPPFYFDCECDPGWTKIKIGNITLPPCMLPNCTVDMGCGSPSPPPVLPAINSTDACSFTWCGEGTCKMTTGGIFPVPECICNEGSLNLLNLTGLPCVKECSLGVDCLNLGLGSRPLPPPPSPDGSVPSDGSRSKGGDGGSLAKNGVNWFEGSIVLMVLSVALQLIV